MPAQVGSSILLQYGQQGTQQPGSSILLQYDNGGQATTLRVRSQTVGAWAQASKQEKAVAAPYPSVSVEDHARAAPWGAADGRDAEDSAHWNKAALADAGRASPWGMFGDAMNEERGSGWISAARMDDARRSLWDAFGDMLNEDRGSRWFGSKAIDRERGASWRGFLIKTLRPIPYVRPAGNAASFSVAGGGIDAARFPAGGYVAPLGGAIGFQFGAGGYVAPWMPENPNAYAIPEGNAASFLYAPQFEIVLDGSGNPVIDKSSRDTHQIVPWGIAVRRDKDEEHPWLKYSRPLNPGWGIVTPGGPEEPTPGESIIIPVQRVYIVVNEIQLARVDDNTPIPAGQLSVSFDCDSWLPQFSATIPESARDSIMPDPNPVEVYAFINGSEFRFFVEKVARSRQFAQRSVTISGRGIACELDAPYATAAQRWNATDKTAQQIIDDALGFTTYTQTWNATDWLVPAGAFSLYGTPAEVAGYVADAAGAVLSADWALRDLRMLPRYPVKPWEWATATPDYIIPAAITQTESVEWIERPAYNVVYVSGVQAGVIGQVKRTGTAGDKPAPMVTHPLITHNDAARQKGISILGNTGRKALMQISMPVLESTGVIDICRLIEFSDGANTRRGIVRANSVSVNYPTVRQTLTIEAAA